MRAFWLHLRSSPSRVVVIPLAAAHLAVLLLRSHFWVGMWPETGGAVNPPAAVGSLLCVTASAWFSSRGDADGTRLLASSSSTRPSAHLETMRFAAHLTWVLAAYLVTVLTAFVMSAYQMSASGGVAPGLSSFGWYCVVALTLLLLAAGWGWLVGRLLPPMVSAPVALLSWFIVTSLVTGATNDVSPVSGPAWWDADPVVLWTRLGAVLLFCAVLCLVPVRGSRSFGWGLLLPLAGAATAVTVLGSTTLLTPRPAPVHPRCFTGALQYCLWPEEGAYQPLVLSVDEQVGRLPLELPLPARLVGYGMSGHTTWVDGIEHEVPGDFEPELLVQEGSRWSVADGLARAISDEVFAGCSSEPGSLRGRLSVQAWLEARLAGGGVPDYAQPGAPTEVQEAYDAGRRAAALADVDQAQWARETIEDARAACSAS